MMYFHAFRKNTLQVSYYKFILYIKGFFNQLVFVFEIG